MGKITFRADDDLVDELESFNASKSEVMREALRTYLHDDPTSSTGTDRDRSVEDDRPPEPGWVEDLVSRRIDDVLESRLPDRSAPSGSDVSVTIALEGVDGTIRSSDSVASDTSTPVSSGAGAEEPRPPETPSERTNGATPSERGGAENRSCGQCGERVDEDHVYCPNCGEKASRRLFCECGDEVRSDWSFCPSCGRRTPAADVLDSGGHHA